MRRPTSPPPMAFFEPTREPLGPRSIRLELGRIAVVLRGLDADLAESILQRYGPFGAPAEGTEPGLQVDVAGEDVDYFIDPPPRPEFNPIHLECDGNRVRYLGYRAAGWFDTLDGNGRLLLGSGDYEPATAAVENYVRAAVAWQAASRGGALVHAASAVWRERGYLFFGESGAGKSTLSECNRRARVVSDDLSLILPDASGELQLVGSPFRGTYEGGEPVLGEFPLVAGFRIMKDTRAEVRHAPAARLLSELVANLPFVAEAFSRRPDLFESVVQGFGPLPMAHLHFAKDDTYWDAVERAGW